MTQMNIDIWILTQIVDAALKWALKREKDKI